jgi:serine phosphatase RsbU (regulator of sigma subunit)
VYLPALFVHFLALFPDRTTQGIPRALVRFGYLVASTLFGVSLVVAVGREAVLPIAPLAAALQTAAALWFAVGLALSFGMFAVAFVKAAPGDTRRRLRVAFAGTVLGVGPLAAFILIRNIAPTISLPGERMVVPLTLLVPASFAWATVVHAVFDFRVALRIATVALVLAGLGALLYVIGEWLAATWWPHGGSGIAGVALALVAIEACVAGPLLPWMRSLGSHVIPEPHPTSLAAWVAHGFERREQSLEQVLAEAADVLQRTLRLDGCAVLAYEAGDERTEGCAGAFARPGAVPEFDRAAGAQPGVRALDETDLGVSDRTALERAGVCWLLPVGNEPLRGVALLGRRLAGSWLDRHEILELERFARDLAISLENTALKRAAHGRVHLDRELREAGAIQAHLLPRRAPVYPTLDCAAAALSSESVGGDYYDFVQGPERDFTVAVGDAAGHGVPAALVLAGVQARFRSEARRGLAPGELLQALNLELVGLDQPEKFVGLLCARFDVRSGRLDFANAGLTPPLLRRRDGSFEELTAGGVLLGVSVAAFYPDEFVVLGAGDMVVIYTDGLTEARRGDTLFGVEGVRRVLDAHATARAIDVLDALLTEVRRFSDHELDDVTVVVLRQLTAPISTETAVRHIPLKWSRKAAENFG